MEKNDINQKEYYVVDIAHIMSALWRRLWAIVIVGVIVAGVAFSYASFFIKPRYAASVMLYVNNSSFSVGSTNFSISSSEISAAQSLVKTYIVILNNRTTLEKVIKNTGVPYTYEELSRMIDATAIDETEVFRIRITCEDPYEAAKIANGISEVLPDRVADVIEGASMRLVDKAVVDVRKVSPSITKYTLAGFAVGIMLCAAFVIILAFKDETIHDENFILNNFDFPILAKVPDMNESDSNKYKYYSYKSDNKSNGKRG